MKQTFFSSILISASMVAAPFSMALTFPQVPFSPKNKELVRGNGAEAATLDPLKAEGLAEMHIIRDLFEAW